MSDLTSHLSQSQNVSDSLSTREAHEIQESARHLKSQAQFHSQQYGISEHESMSLLLGGNLPAIGGGSYSRNSATDEAAQAARNIANTEDFQRHVQKVNDFARFKAHSLSNEEGVLLAEGTTKSFDETLNSQKQYQIAKSRSEQLSETASWAEQNTHLIRKALNQDLVSCKASKQSDLVHNALTGSWPSILLKLQMDHLNPPQEAIYFWYQERYHFTGCALVPETFHILYDKVFDQMKPGLFHH